jgi:hypothetical protein
MKTLDDLVDFGAQVTADLKRDPSALKRFRNRFETIVRSFRVEEALSVEATMALLGEGRRLPPSIKEASRSLQRDWSESMVT